MIIRFKGEFTKEELLQAFEEQLDQFIQKDWTCKGTFYLNIYNEKGSEIDLIDTKTNESFELTVRSPKKRKALSVTDIEKVKDMLAQGMDPSDIANQLKIADSSIKKATTQLTELEESGDDSLPLLKKTDFDTSMFTESEIDIARYNDWNPEKVGLYKNKKGKLELVYSFQRYFEEINASIYRDIHSMPHYFVPVSAFDFCKDLIKDVTKMYGVLLTEKGLEMIIDVRDVAKAHNITYFESEDDGEEFVSSYYLKNILNKEQYIGKEIGFYIPTYSRPRDCFVIPLYDQQALFKENGIHYITDDEIEQYVGKTLFKTNAVQNYYPSSYGVKNLLELYGYTSEGTKYYHPICPLYEHFGLIEEVLDTYYVVDPTKATKLRTLLRDNGTKLDDIKPLGMTKDYLLVYDKQSIPQEIRDEYNAFLEKKLLS